MLGAGRFIEFSFGLSASLSLGQQVVIRSGTVRSCSVIQLYLPLQFSSATVIRTFTGWPARKQMTHREETK